MGESSRCDSASSRIAVHRGAAVCRRPGQVEGAGCKGPAVVLCEAQMLRNGLVCGAQHCGCGQTGVHS